MSILNEGMLLDGMFKQKHQIIDALYKQGMVPKLDIAEIQKSYYQTFIKKLVSWITDELAEASIENAKAVDAYLNDNNPDSRQKNMTESSLFAAMEMMDAMHFFIELFVYVDITPEDINSYYEQLCHERNLPIHMGDGLSSSMNYARHTVIYDDKIRELTYSSRLQIAVLNIELLISEDLNWFKEMAMWDTVKALSDACRELKNKEWATIEKPVDERNFKLKIMIAWLYFCKLLDISGLTNQGIYNLYEKTSNKILKRLEHGY